ncbi:helix-turn-helix domain-containing protein [Silvanigrella aquatica]|uniref:HTH cro/C1-type domain-containing protein n=1 Tax=Silvanigrella aquatica TaxID=1915309 RepID=A0A1L4D1N6_9BACT|nr:hypothetical protein [Silvanigrella aquatica]APJ04108.1 hypothetical protein AXG55_09385 [Silvanigrella aquatica]
MKNNIVPYDELGFRIYLINPDMYELPDGTKVPAPNMKILQDEVFKILCDKPFRLTGNELHFIRKYMHMTQQKFSELLNLSNHSIVSQWENKDDAVCGMDYNTEVLLRLSMEVYISNTISAEKLVKLKNMPNRSEPIYVRAA